MIQKIKGTLTKNKPGLCCIGGGLLVLFGSVLLAYKAYKKVDEINEDHETRMAELDNTLIDEETGNEVPAVQNRGGFIIKNYAITTGMFVKEFAIPIGCVVGGIGLMGKGALEYKSRYIGAASALALRSAEFDSLCHRVIDRYGQEGYDIINGIEPEEYSETVVDDDGNEVTNTGVRHVLKDEEDRFKGHPNRKGYLTFVLDETCYAYDPSPYYELEAVHSMEVQTENEVELHDRVGINDILRRFHIPECKDLATIGWNKNDPNYHGVSFGIEKPYAENIALRKGDSSYKNVLILTFNCTGDMYVNGYDY